MLLFMCAQNVQFSGQLSLLRLASVDIMSPEPLVLCPERQQASHSIQFPFVLLIHKYEWNAKHLLDCQLTQTWIPSPSSVFHAIVYRGTAVEC